MLVAVIIAAFALAAFFYSPGNMAVDNPPEATPGVNEDASNPSEENIPASPSPDFEEIIDGSEELNTMIDETSVPVMRYEATYCESDEAGEESEQKLSVYVPEHATKESPIVLLLNNSGWQQNTYEAALNRVVGYNEEAGTGTYESQSAFDTIGRALSDGYVIVVYGARSRNDAAVNGEYLGHSPAVVVDTKAAIRWLRQNEDILPAGDPEKIIALGSSGGGGLATVLGASGDSEDYYEALYEIGAAGIDFVNGKYVSTISDAIYAVVACCPIADFGIANEAYEWTFGASRETLLADGSLGYTDVENTDIIAASEELRDQFPAYVESLGLVAENGSPITAEKLDEMSASLMEATISSVVSSQGTDVLKEQLETREIPHDTWLTFGKKDTYTYDYQQQVDYIAATGHIKIAPAFSNFGLYNKQRSEDTLFGGTGDIYSPFTSYSWNNDTIANNVGKDDTGMAWESYLSTARGEELRKQLKMVGSIEYLADKNDGKTAPYWYVRCGMLDCDSSFALDTLRYAALCNDEAVEKINFSYMWLQGHTGNYNAMEAFDWLANVTATPDE